MLSKRKTAKEVQGEGVAVWILNVLTTTTRRRWGNRNGAVKTAAWRTFRRSALHHAVKNKRVTVQGPVKKPPMDYMSHRGVAPDFFVRENFDAGLCRMQSPICCGKLRTHMP